MFRNIELIILFTLMSLSFTIVKDTELIEKKEISDQLINELSSNIDDYNCVYDIGYHLSYKITEKDISFHDKAIKISKYFNKDNADKVYGKLPDESHLNLYFKKERFIDKGKELFGDDFTFNIKEGSIESMIDENFIYENGYFIKKYYYGGGCCQSNFYKKIINSELDGNYIYIYDKYLYLEGNIDNMDEIFIYNSFDKNKKIATSNKSIFDNFDEFLEEANTFKHTFKKNKKGNYYWISSEMIK